ncbi:SDR family oxidoreductase [Umezawaea endophytica]|uniref:NAD(P)H-binding protein n=1 Tax=Umezawaea endophytica TaxID=1654476 RepID=A0A9X2VRU7_9PSEU|nr:NAD(P)H-binding protein [Umezawaea endophytica]MCS7481027.1 NAD(P)H-binding protein [Umezawaea endophytica]
MTNERMILVTGATGTVGAHLVGRLLADGHRVRALTRAPERADLPEAVEVVRGDLADVDGLDGVFDGVDAAHLITFDGSAFGPLTTGAEIVALAEKAGVRRMTVLKGDLEPSPLETAIDASGLERVFLAPVEFMANTLDWVAGIRDEGVVREGFPDVPSALVHEADIAAVAAVGLTGPEHGRTHWITGPEALTPRERVRIAADVLGRELELVELSRDEVVAGWRGSGFTEEDVEFFLRMRTEPPEAGYRVLPTVAEVTGVPARTFASWVREHAALF